VRVIERVDDLSADLDAERARGRSVGLVPTMGALHDGHLSLVERSARQCDTTCVTIFVNPLQFGTGEDLAAYPRDLDGDVRAAAAAGAEIVFAPSVEEMYPAPPATTVRVVPLADVLEGARRPGHLDGVATVVTKLLAMAGRCRAYFGEKDWQQLALVRRLAADLSFPVAVVGCPTVRERDGVALSSRNAYLDPAEREAAPVLLRALRAGVAALHAGERDPAAVVDLVEAVIDAEPLAHPDGVDLCDAVTLEPVAEAVGELRLLAAARFGRARLIDNLGITVAPG
jgi:pantoate--beta-alanine ligase